MDLCSEEDHCFGHAPLMKHTASPWSPLPLPAPHKQSPGTGRSSQESTFHSHLPNLDMGVLDRVDIGANQSLHVLQVRFFHLLEALQEHTRAVDRGEGLILPQAPWVLGKLVAALSTPFHLGWACPRIKPTTHKLSRILEGGGAGMALPLLVGWRIKALKPLQRHPQGSPWLAAPTDLLWPKGPGSQS